MTIVKVICGWCRGEFEVDNIKKSYGYGVKVCSHCGRIVSSSRKKDTGNIFHNKHIHEPLREGDIV